MGGRRQRGLGGKVSKAMPWANHVGSLRHRGVVGTHQGAIKHEHLKSCVDKSILCFHVRESTSVAKHSYDLDLQPLQVGSTSIALVRKSQPE